MKARLKFYSSLITTIFLSLSYLGFFFYYDWSVGDYQTFNEAFKAIISQNPRWITWGVCTGGVSLIVGLVIAAGLLFAPSDEEFFEYFVKDFLSTSIQKTFPVSIRGIGIFIAVVIIGMLIFSEGGWRLGLRNGLDIVGVFVWIILLGAILILIPTLLVNIFHKDLQNLLIRILSKDNGS